MRRASHRRVCGPAPQDVLNLGGRWKKPQEGKGREKERRAETHPTQAVQRGPLRQEDLPPWYGHAAIRRSPHIRPALE